MLSEQQERTCCFTGHRDIPQRHKEEIVRRLKNTIRDLAARGVVYYGAGGALGFDTLAAQSILDLQAELPIIKLILVLPCPSQAERWKTEDKMIYENIKARADKLVYVSREYTRDCMFKRNRHLVDNSGICVCYLERNTGGTAYTVDYARKKGLEIINLAY